MIFLEDKQLWIGGMTSLIMGGFISLFPLLAILFGSHKKDIQYAKEALSNNPQELVWAYVLNNKTNGTLTSIDVIMKFRNKVSIMITDRALPEKNTEKFLRALYSLNPSIKLGYSKEIEAKYDKQLL